MVALSTSTDVFAEPRAPSEHLGAFPLQGHARGRLPPSLPPQSLRTRCLGAPALTCVLPAPEGAAGNGGHRGCSALGHNDTPEACRPAMGGGAAGRSDAMKSEDQRLRSGHHGQYSLPRAGWWRPWAQTSSGGPGTQDSKVGSRGASPRPGLCSELGRVHATPSAGVGHGVVRAARRKAAPTAPAPT